MYYQTRAIILGKRNRLEDDRIYSVYSEDFGKLSLLAKGSRKIKSKLAGSVAPPALSEIYFISGRRHDHLAGAEILNSFTSIKTSFYKIAYASYALELYDQMIKDKEPDTKLFDLLKDYLEELEKFNNPPLKIRGGGGSYVSPNTSPQPSPWKGEGAKHLRIWFLANFLSHLGYSPAAKAKPEFHKHELASLEDKVFSEVDFSDNNISRINNILQKDLHHVLERPLRSEEFLKSMSSWKE